MKILQYFILCSCFVFVIVNSHPITSQPLTNNPDSWALEDSWLIFNPKNVVSQAEPLISSYDPRAKKVTAKSIFIAPNTNFLGSSPAKLCQPGQRVDENGNCIKIVTVNQDELLIHQLQQLLQHKGDAGAKPSIDYGDYYDDVEDAEESQGPFQVNLPLVFDNEANSKNITEDDRKNNENLSNIKALVDQEGEGEEGVLTTIQPAAVTTTTETMDDEPESTMSTILETLPTEIPTFLSQDDDETETTTVEATTTTTTTEAATETTTLEDTTTETNPVTTTTVDSLETTTLFQKQEQETTVEPEVVSTTTLEPISTKLRNHRTKSHRRNESLFTAESQNTRRRQKTTAQNQNRGEQKSAASSNVAIIDRHQLPKKKEQTTYVYPQPTTRVDAPTTRLPRRKSSKSTTRTTTPRPTTTSTQWPPVILIPKASDFVQKQNSPKLIRFWSNMPLVEDATPARPAIPFSQYPHYHYSNSNYNNGYQRRRSHLPQYQGSRINSRQPSEKFFREVTFQELQSVLRV